MMAKRKHRIISSFIAIILFFAGMHADTFSAESFSGQYFAGKTTAIPASCHSAYDTVCHSTSKNDAVIYTTETPDVCIMTLPLQEKFQEQYRESNAFFYLQCSGINSLLQKKSYIRHASTYLFCQTQNGLVTEYIHQSDGKKRI